MQQLILLHGAFKSKRQLEPLATYLSKDFQVHTFNFSGHGIAPFADEFGIAQFTREVDAFMQENTIEKAALFGYSMGGYVALNFAAQHPEKVIAVCTYGTKFRWNPQVSKEERTKMNPELIEQKVPAFAKALAEDHGKHWRDVLRHTARMVEALGSQPLLTDSLLAHIQTPALIMRGTKDTMITMEETESTAEALPRGEKQDMAGMEHVLENIDPRILGQSITRFLHRHI